MSTPFKKTTKILAPTGICILLLFGSVACSSGSGSPASPAPPATPLPPPPPPPAVSDAEIAAQPGLTQINIQPAFDNDILGQGALIAIIDTGIDVDNAEFAGRIDPRSADLGVAPFTDNEDARQDADLQDNQGHGTSVAGIAAAAANGQGVVGVAPAATLLIFRGNLADDPDTEDDDEALTILGGAISEGFLRAAEANADVINLSLGSDEDGARESFAGLLAFAGGNDIVTIISAGNDGGDDPQQSGQSVVDAEAAGTGIVVGAVDFNNNIASFSNLAGLAADFFIVAPGLGVPTPDIGGGTRPFSGTSASAPHVAGAVGLIRGLWPQLSASETVDIILSSATDLGEVGTDPIFGRGLLNVGAALEPSGQLSVPSATGASVPVSNLASNLPSALGSAFSNIDSVIGLDEFGRDFNINLGGLVQAAPANRFPLGHISDPLRRIQTARTIAPTPGASLTLRLSETSAATDRQYLHLIGDIDNNEAFDAGQRDLAFSFTQALGVGKGLTIANGFSAREIDRAQNGLFSQHTLSRTAFSDAFLPDTPNAISAGFNITGRSGLAYDLFVNHALDDIPFQAGVFPGTLPLAANSPLLQEDRATTTTVRLGITRVVPGGAVRFETGVQTEANGFLGTALAPSLFGDGGSQTFYNAVSGHLAFPGSVFLTGRFSLGLTQLRDRGADTLFIDAGALRSTQFSLGLQKIGFIGSRDLVSLSLSQPLQVRRGALSLSLPTSFNQQTEQAQFSNVAADFSNSALPLDIELGYAFNGFKNTSLQLNAGHSVSGFDSGQTALSFRMVRGF